MGWWWVRRPDLLLCRVRFQKSSHRRNRRIVNEKWERLDRDRNFQLLYITSNRHMQISWFVVFEYHRCICRAVSDSSVPDPDFFHTYLYVRRATADAGIYFICGT